MSAEARPPDVPATLTAAFLDLDRRQGVAQAAAAAAAVLYPESCIASEWESVTQRCYAATTAYLQLNEVVDGPAPQAANVAHLLADATTTVDQFYLRHRRALDAASAAAGAASTAADEANRAAHDAEQRLARTEAPWRDYPSVHTANLLLQTALAELVAARSRSDFVASQSSSDRLSAAATALHDALDRAPGRAKEASQAIASVRTRLQALHTRFEGFNATMSELLREFNAESSDDLWGNETGCCVELYKAADLLRQAEAAEQASRPEEALDLLETARTVLTVAATLVDAPSERLTLLRGVRSDPTSHEQRVRFRVRDAQRLAVDQGAQGDWGPALDAQVLRIDRAVASLSGRRHPDYWRYHHELEDVSKFVARVVDRIRQECAR